VSRLLLSLAVIGLLAVPASGQDAGTGEACAAIGGDAERLACYDAIFQGTAPNGELPALRIESEQQIPARPTGRVPAGMVVACAGGTLSVTFDFARQLLSATNDDAPITFQVDQGGNIVRNLPVSADNTSIGYSTTRESQAFLEGLEGGTSLKVRITPVRQRSLTVDFRLREHESEIAALREACR
jgi:hypothetical protein